MSKTKIMFTADQRNTIQSNQEMTSTNNSVRTETTKPVYENLFTLDHSPEPSRTTGKDDGNHYEDLNHGYDNPAVYASLDRQSRLSWA